MHCQLDPNLSHALPTSFKFKSSVIFITRPSLLSYKNYRQSTYGIWMSNRMQVTRWKRRSGKPRRGKSQVKVPQWTEGGPYPNTFKNTIKRGHSLLLPFQFFIQNMLCIFFSLKKKHNHDNSEWRLKYYCMTCLPHNIILHSFAISFQSIKPMDDIERSDS